MRRDPGGPFFNKKYITSKSIRSTDSYETRLFKIWVSCWTSKKWVLKSQILQLTFKQCCFGIYFSKEYYSTKKACESYTKLRKD